jgi:hypothetical protein
MRAAVIALVMVVTGCKGLGHLGGLAHGLGHVASGLGHVAKVAAVSSKALAPVWRGVVRAAPNVINAAAALSGDVVVEHDEVVVEHVPVEGGPLIDNGDPCGYCPDNRECGACGDANGVACVLTPPGAYARCESQR